MTRMKKFQLLECLHALRNDSQFEAPGHAKHRGDDRGVVISAVDPTLLPVTTKTAFEARYCFKARIGGDGPWTIAGYRNVGELHGYINSISSRVTKKEALDLPDKVISTRYVEMESDQKRV